MREVSGRSGRRRGSQNPGTDWSLNGRLRSRGLGSGRATDHRHRHVGYRQRDHKAKPVRELLGFTTRAVLH